MVLSVRNATAESWLPNAIGTMNIETFKFLAGDRRKVRDPRVQVDSGCGRGFFFFDQAIERNGSLYLAFCFIPFPLVSLLFLLWQFWWMEMVCSRNTSSFPRIPVGSTAVFPIYCAGPQRGLAKGKVTESVTKCWKRNLQDPQAGG